jgi:hypothetical protein
MSPACTTTPAATAAARAATGLRACAGPRHKPRGCSTARITHIVFTLPHELIALWAHNRGLLADTLFRCARDTVIELCAERRFLGATPGIIMALHTWGRTLNAHPHVHCLVSGGGLTRAGDWRPANNGYLLPVRVVKALYRGKVLGAITAALEAGRLRLPAQDTRSHWARCVRALYRKNWNVHLRERYAHGRGVLRYLARYVKGGPIPERRLQSASAREVTFAYTDHHDGRPKHLCLGTSAFIARVLWHAPEPGQHTVRHYGLYANSAHARLDRARHGLGQLPVAPAPSTNWQAQLERLGAAEKTRCARCNKPLIRGITLARRGALKQISLSNAVPSEFAQPGVEADTPNAPSIPATGPPEPSRASFFSAAACRLTKSWAFR